MPLSILLMLLVLAGLLVASAFFSGSETALFSLSRHQRARLQARQNVLAHTTATLLSETRALLITLLLGNMSVNVLYFVISSVLLIKANASGHYGTVALAGLSLAPLVVIVLLGEVLPKLVAAKKPEAFTQWIALPLLAIHRGIAPLRIAASACLITPLSRLLAPPAPPPDLSPQELESMLQLSRKHGVIDHSEQRVLEQVLDLSRLKVRNLMVPRVDIQAFNLDDGPQGLVELIRKTKLRHIPAYSGNLDNIQGLLHTRHVLLADPQTPQELQTLVRQVRFIPELQRGDRALIDLRKTGTTIAMVVDEYGGTSGLVTLEDLVEHLVGDIPGAFEASGEVNIAPTGPGQWRVDANLSVHEWQDVFGRHPRFEAAKSLQSATTVGGLVMAELGRVPKVGDAIDIGNVHISVDAMEGHRIHSVLITLKGLSVAPQPSPGPTPQEPHS